MSNYRKALIAKVKKIPISIPLFTTLTSLYGFILLYSAAGGHIEPWAYKQLLVFLIFMPVSVLIATIDQRVIYNFAYIFYFITLLLLLFVELMGKSAMGATRWLDLGFFTIQPSELVKISVVMMLARLLHEHNSYTRSDFILIIPLIASIIPIYLVVKQPDLGTGMVTLIVVCCMFFAAGVKKIYFIISGIIGLATMPAVWFMLYDYQRNRVLTFINPEADPLGKGYNIIQSKIAIGSGGFWGKGLLSSTQGSLSFLPEYETDFIFSFLTEELGFVGGITLLILYSLIIISSLSVAINCRSKFARLLTIGIITLFFCHIFINIAMVMGLLPAVGVPLPLISYGRTMMVSMLLGFSLIMNSAVNRHRNV